MFKFEYILVSSDGNYFTGSTKTGVLVSTNKDRAYTFTEIGAMAKRARYTKLANYVVKLA